MRHWWRYRAVLLRAEGTPVAVVARTLGCSEASVYNWIGRAGSEDFASLVDYHDAYQPGARRFDVGSGATLR